MNVPAPHAGDIVWCIGRTGALRRIFMHPLLGALAEVRTSRFSRDTITLNADDVFTDRNACRAEIQRRASETKEPSYG
jgi:hypothetical protein